MTVGLVKTTCQKSNANAIDAGLNALMAVAERCFNNADEVLAGTADLAVA